MNEEISERDKKLKENEKLCWNNYMRGYMRGHRKNEPRIEKEINLAPKEQEVKSGRQEYMQDYFRKKSGFPEPKIKNVKSYVEDIKKYPADFPKEEFGKKLDKILVEKTPITEKTLQDLIYDIMDRRGILTPEIMIMIYNSLRWERAIEVFMNEKKYSLKKEGKENVYIRN